MGSVGRHVALYAYVTMHVKLIRSFSEFLNFRITRNFWRNVSSVLHAWSCFLSTTRMVMFLSTTRMVLFLVGSNVQPHNAVLTIAKVFSLSVVA